VGGTGMKQKLKQASLNDQFRAELLLDDFYNALALTLLNTFCQYP
jgi:hypothetical protein